MTLHPRHRGDCADFFTAPHETARIQFDLPVSVRSAIELAAAKAGRTWNAQITYVMGVCLREYLPDFDDLRSVEDWRTLLSQGSFRFSETESWHPLTSLKKGSAQ